MNYIWTFNSCKNSYNNIRNLNIAKVNSIILIIKFWIHIFSILDQMCTKITRLIFVCTYALIDIYMNLNMLICAEIH